jgi:hypothetical protein
MQQVFSLVHSCGGSGGVTLEQYAMVAALHTTASRAAATCSQSRRAFAPWTMAQHRSSAVHSGVGCGFAGTQKFVAATSQTIASAADTTRLQSLRSELSVSASQQRSKVAHAGGCIGGCSGTQY